MTIQQPLSFDHEFTLAELLTGINTGHLIRELTTLLNSPVQILDSQQKALFGDAPPIFDNPQTVNRVALYGELEAIGYIQATAPEALLKSAAEMVQLILKSNARYLMASSLQIQTQSDDYEELQRRHHALEKLKEKYKALAESLDLRVKEQVKTIETAQLQLYENEKLASVGRLAAGVAHEINNPIGFIRSNLCSAQTYMESFIKLEEAFKAQASIAYLQHLWKEENLEFLQEDLSDIVSESIDGVDRVASIVKDLKSFSRVNDAKEEVDINDIIRQMCHVSSPQCQEKLEIILELSEIPRVYCRPAELGQVFLNLFLNAADAIDTHGKIRFKTSLQHENIHIQIQDTGCGIAEQNLPHIFDPFFTTKEVGQGIGLGLTVSLNVIKAHGGTMKVSSQSGKGTVVTISLPIDQSPETTQH